MARTTNDGQCLALIRSLTNLHMEEQVRDSRSHTVSTVRDRRVPDENNLYLTTARLRLYVIMSGQNGIGIALQQAQNGWPANESRDWLRSANEPWTSTGAEWTPMYHCRYEEGMSFETEEGILVEHCLVAAGSCEPTQLHIASPRTEVN